jgi:hypothetical protein
MNNEEVYINAYKLTAKGEVEVYTKEGDSRIYFRKVNETYKKIGTISGNVEHQRKYFLQYLRSRGILDLKIKEKGTQYMARVVP